MLNQRRFRSEIINSGSYRGYPIMYSKRPFIAKYLDRTIDVLENSLAAHPRTLAVRFDLRLPLYARDWNEHRLIDRFISSLKAKIKSSRRRAAKVSAKGKAHQTDVRYVWTREVGKVGKASELSRPHYHFALLLNRDAYRVMGKYETDRDNLFCRVLEAWASALRIEVEDAEGLVHVPKNATYWINANDPDSQDDFFYRTSYLAKAETKVLGSRHSFGSSRR